MEGQEEGQEEVEGQEEGQEEVEGQEEYQEVVAQFRVQLVPEGTRTHHGSPRGIFNIYLTHVDVLRRMQNGQLTAYSGPLSLTDWRQTISQSLFTSGAKSGMY